MARTSIAPPESASVKRLSIMIGFHRAPGSMHVALDTAHVTLCDRTAHHVLPLIEPHQCIAMATLGFTSPYGLGLDGAQPFHRIMAAAKARGLEPCPPEVGPMLRLVYDNQPDDEWVTVATRSFCDDLGMVHFVLGNKRGEKILRVEPGEAATCFASDALFVFLERIVPPLRA